MVETLDIARAHTRKQEIRGLLGGRLPEGSNPDLNMRRLLREWMELSGFKTHQLDKMKIITMVKCYNSPSYMAAVTRSRLRKEAHAEPTATASTHTTVLPAAQSQGVSTETLQSLTAIRRAVEEMRSKTVTLDQVMELIRKHAAPPPPAVIQIKTETKTTELKGRHHKMFPSLLKACSARTPSGQRLNVMMVGPAGSGKTTAAENVAKALKVPFFFNGAVDTEYKLLGFTDAHGKVVKRPFREAFSKPSVYLFDEIDGSHPNGCLPLNAALSNGAVDFPDAIEHRHKDCVIIAAANTFGLGGTSDYVGRNKLDAAFLDRFVMINWDIDEELERDLCEDKSWAAYVQQVRAKAKLRGIRVVISPRSTIYGASLIKAGLDRQQVAAMTIKKGMSDDQWSQVSEGVTP